MDSADSVQLIAAGNAHFRAGKFDEATESYLAALKSNPGSVEARCNLGTALKAMGKLPEAIEQLRAAAALRPYWPEIHNNIGNALVEADKSVEAVIAYRTAISLRPAFAEAYAALGSALVSQRHVADGINHLRAAIRLNPRLHEAGSSLLLALHYEPRSNDDAAGVLEEHRGWSRAMPVPIPPVFTNTPEPDRPLRIGYVSADFRRHSVAHFLEPILANHDRSRCEITCYSAVAWPDEVTARFRAYATTWRDIGRVDDATVCRQIAADRIDILVDLAGHTGGGRMPLFARQAAPIQITYLGYPGTTGLPTIGYRFTDAIANPPGVSDLYHTENLIRLSPPFVCFSPPTDAPDVSPTPAQRNGFITFGSFNALPKIASITIQLWAATLRAVAGSRLLIKARGLHQEEIAGQLKSDFAREGISEDRLTLLGHEASTPSHLARYHEIDIALDTFPYNGTTTTCEALWMGVPVVTLAGQVHASRVGASLMTAINQPGWIANSAQDFVRIASELAADFSRLASIRNQMRPLLRSSSLMDGARLTRSVEAAYREIWQDRSHQADGAEG